MNAIIGFLCALSMIVPATTSSLETVVKDDLHNNYTEIIVGQDAKEYAYQVGVEDFENVEEVYISNGVEESDSNIMPCYFGDDYYIKEKTIVTSYEKGDLIRRSQYDGPAVATMTVSETLSATFSFDFSIGVSELKAKLGYSTTSTFGVSDSYSIDITNNCRYAIECYVNVEKKTFEVWEDDLFFDDYVGEYYSTKPIGCIFCKIRL